MKSLFGNTVSGMITMNPQTETDMNTEIIFSPTTDTLTFILIDTRADRLQVAKEIHPLLKAVFGNTLQETLLTVGRLRSERAVTLFTWGANGFSVNTVLENGGKIAK